ncbi:unnamed protein product [Staurois parvus]|uniref:Uncharacterized protein n=1 Tax=Staurois parvus TaxID=386267 RepID=A0ABN9AYG3_9NEOB|nr:unnamed protein product [Staurois parvus]
MKNSLGFPPKSIPDPYPSMQPGRSGKGWDERAPPPPSEPYQAHALNMGGCFGAGGLPPPQSTLSPC